MFGIATAITVRLEPIPPSVRTLLADFPTVRAASEAVSAIIASGIVPAALEMMDQACVAAVEASIYAAGYPDRRRGGAPGGARRPGATRSRPRRRSSSAILRERGARDVRSASTAADRARLWQGRKKAFGAHGPDRARPRGAGRRGAPLRPARHHGPDRGASATGYGLSISNVFHAGDGNLHPEHQLRPARPGARPRGSHAACREIMAGLRRRRRQHHRRARRRLRQDRLHAAGSSTPTTLGAMCAVRRVFDPAERANPGKVVPAARLPGVAAAPERADERRASIGRLRALLGTERRRARPRGAAPRDARDRRRARAGLPAGARGGLEDPGRGRTAPGSPPTRRPTSR